MPDPVRPARLGLGGVSVKLRRYDACGGREGKGFPAADGRSCVKTQRRARVFHPTTVESCDEIFLVGLWRGAKQEEAAAGAAA